MPLYKTLIKPMANCTPSMKKIKIKALGAEWRTSIRPIVSFPTNESGKNIIIRDLSPD